LPLTSRAHCHALAERLVARIAAHDFGLGGRTVTVSIGIAEHRIGESRDSLMACADRHLYAAKHAGRNRVSGER
ncbi:MAG TPA: diguanylate cyclase, partial [Longimicrobiales bacterium]|nr:diguanylate cyclase [Longimicrobiales bacterium]